MMDNGDIEFSNQELFSGPNIGGLSNCYMDSFFEEIFKDTHACTHTHTCNPPGPDNSHSHTCYHVHTKIVPDTPSENKASTDNTAESTKKKAKKPLGNQEAVRKYREKKKAKVASLEDEVVRLRAVNQQLLKRLQSRAVLEAEVSRLKCLLVDIRGRVEGEIGSFPYQKPANGTDTYQTIANNSSLPSAYAMNPCDMHCDNQAYCLHPGLESKSREDMALYGIQAFNECEFENLQFLSIQNSGLKSSSGCRLGNGVATLNSSNGNEQKVTRGDACCNN